MGFQLMPAPKGTCPECAVDHLPEEPHNAVSLQYQYSFFAKQGRWPTWKDAIAHCDEDVREVVEKTLRQMGKWTEPDSEVPDVLPTDDGSIGSVTKFDLQ